MPKKGRSTEKGHRRKRRGAPQEPFRGIDPKAATALLRLERQWLRGVAEEDRLKVLFERRGRFLSGPLAMPKGEVRAFSKPGGEFTPRLQLHIEMRMMALALLNDVDIFDLKWWDQTCVRHAARTVRGGTDWFLPGERGGSRGIVLDHEWPEVERLLENAPRRGKTAALRPFLERKGVPARSIREVARKVIEAQRVRLWRRLRA